MPRTGGMHRGPRRPQVRPSIQGPAGNGLVRLAVELAVVRAASSVAVSIWISPSPLGLKSPEVRALPEKLRFLLANGEIGTISCSCSVRFHLHGLDRDLSPPLRL